MCQGFVSAIEAHLPEWKTKPKIHLLLHLPDDMLMYGPTAAFNMERYNVLHVQFKLTLKLYMSTLIDVEF